MKPSFTQANEINRRFLDVTGTVSMGAACLSPRPQCVAS